MWPNCNPAKDHLAEQHEVIHCNERVLHMTTVFVATCTLLGSIYISLPLLGWTPNTSSLCRTGHPTVAPSEEVICLPVLYSGPTSLENHESPVILPVFKSVYSSLTEFLFIHCLFTKILFSTLFPFIVRQNSFHFIYQQLFFSIFTSLVKSIKVFLYNVFFETT